MRIDRKNVRGFSLVELLVVMAVVAMLVAMLIPTLSRAKEAGRTTVCGTKTREVVRMCLLYSVDWRDRFPTAGLSSLNNAHKDVTEIAALIGTYYNNGTGNIPAVAGVGYTTPFGACDGPLRCPSMTPDFTNYQLRVVSGKWYYTANANTTLAGYLVDTYAPNGNTNYMMGNPISRLKSPARIFATNETARVFVGTALIDAYFELPPNVPGADNLAFGYTNPQFFHYDDSDRVGSTPSYRGSANMGMLDGSLRKMTGAQHKTAVTDGSLSWMPFR